MTDLSNAQECINSMLQINNVRLSGIYLHLAYSGICSLRMFQSKNREKKREKNENYLIYLIYLIIYLINWLYN